MGTRQVDHAVRPTVPVDSEVLPPSAHSRHDLDFGASRSLEQSEDRVEGRLRGNGDVEPCGHC